MVTTPQPPTTPVPSRVFPLPGWSGPINTHWGVGNVGGSDLMVNGSGTQPVVSMVSGKVTYVSSQSSAPHSGGNSIEVHGIDGLDYYYAHLAAPLSLGVGDTVSAGQLFGFADSTGDAAGGPPHLHIGIGHGIITGTTSAGGTGENFDAVAMLRALVNDGSANNTQIVSPQIQASITSGQPIGTINVGAPSAAPVSQSLTDRIRWLASLLAAANAPLDLIPKLTAISLAENHGSDPGATSSTSDVGLFQINIPTWAQKLIQVGIITSIEDLKDPAKNAAAAVYVATHATQGLNSWTTHQQGLDTQYQGQVGAALSGVTLPGGSDPSSGGSTSGPDNCNCGTWNLGPVHIPDLGCVLQCSISNVITQWKTRWLDFWSQWTHAHAANTLFVLAGVAILFVGVAALISGNKQFQATVSTVAAAGAAA